MSCVEVLERWRDSPLRARSFCTVRAAISVARRSDRPCCRWLFLTCSYWRARLLPFFTPRGGIGSPPSSLPGGLPERPSPKLPARHLYTRSRAPLTPDSWAQCAQQKIELSPSTP